MEFRLFNIDDINHTRIIKFLHDFYIDDSYEIKKVGMPSSNEYIIKFVPSIDISSLSKYFKSKRYDFTLKENKMKLSLKERKLVSEYAKKLTGKRLNENDKSNLTDFTPNDLAQLQKILSPIERIVDAAFKIVNKYDTDEWNSITRNASYDLSEIYGILRNFGLDIDK